MASYAPSAKRSFLLAAVVVAAFFGALEAGLRLVGVKRRPVGARLILRAIDTDIDLPFMRADPELFWAPKPGYRGEFQGQPVTINSLGLRGPEPRERRGARRLLCLGDSITFGYGVGDEDTYPAALQRRLAGRDIEVVNGGVTGYTSHQASRLLARIGPALRPDVVTACIGWNDATLRHATDREYARRLRWAQRAARLADHLFLYRAMSNLYARNLDPAPPAARDTPRVPPDEYRTNLAAIARDARAMGARVAFVRLPHRSGPQDPPPDPTYARLLAETAAALEVPLLDVGVLAWDASTGSTEALFIDPLHLSPEGAAEMARRIEEQAAAAGLL
jgi:lysophospholipase L1-like esterase